jgi:hypothetical protein
VWKNLACSSRQLAASANRRFEFQKRRQPFIGTQNVTLSVAVNDNNKGHRHESA